MGRIAALLQTICNEFMNSFLIIDSSSTKLPEFPSQAFSFTKILTRCSIVANVITVIASIVISCIVLCVQRETDIDFLAFIGSYFWLWLGVFCIMLINHAIIAGILVTSRRQPSFQSKLKTYLISYFLHFLPQRLNISHRIWLLKFSELSRKLFQWTGTRRHAIGKQ